MVFVVYQVGAFIFTYMVDGHMDLLGLLKFIPWFKYISFLGVVVLGIDIAWFLMDRSANNQRQGDLEKENNSLKAKIYDLQERGKKTGSD